MHSLRRPKALIAAVAAPIEFAGHQLTVGLSVGGLLVPRATVVAADVVSDADVAMYEAKRSGGGCRMSITSASEPGSVG